MVQLNVAFALLRFSAQVTVTTSETPRDYSEHEAPSARLSGKGCPAGQYVSQPMAGDPGVVACRPCQPGTFSPYASEETSCLPCALCRKDQEVVTECSPTRDRQCQCKRGHFFCDSTDCEENCFRCQRCPPGVGNEGEWTDRGLGLGPPSPRRRSGPSGLGVPYAAAPSRASTFPSVQWGNGCALLRGAPRG
uniref:Tumor necrosis factor receptor superfamily member 10C n=1 Tax=Sus scrofa TaxID=9823 RepID=A0A480PQM4_PIG